MRFMAFPKYCSYNTYLLESKVERLVIPNDENHVSGRQLTSGIQETNKKKEKTVYKINSAIVVYFHVNFCLKTCLMCIEKDTAAVKCSGNEKVHQHCRQT